MRKTLSFSALLLASVTVAGCVDAADELETFESTESTEQEVTDPNFRIYNIVKGVLPAGNYDGVAGNECVALINPEHRLRNIILVQSVAPGARCTLSAYASGNAFSLTWGDTSAYSNSGGAALIRSAIGDTSNAAVHRLTGTLTNEAAALAALQNFLTQNNAQQASQIATFTSTRVHSLYDFEGEEETYAEAAYQAVRVTQPCENPGTPGLYAHTNGGFVYGYVASNTGSCHSGWFTRRHTYNRVWTQVERFEYSE